MTILAGDIQLLKSQVMADTDNGGGASTGVVIIDGKSNDIFPDVSELDHVYGRVSLRKVFVGIHTDDTDTYLGANIILSKPPANPDVSAVLFSTSDDFDLRTAAANRIEAYLSVGAAFDGYLFGNHITGQETLQVQQRVGVPPPVVGDTIDLVWNPALPNEHSQYVRIIDVASVVRTFTDQSGDFTKTILTLTLSSALDFDFTGFDALRIDTGLSYANKTKLFETVVANAATYYGIVPLKTAANFGDYSVQGDGIFTQLVPSSRSELAIPDAKINQGISALISTGTAASFTLGGILSPASPFFVGGGITPGTFSISAGGAGLTDKGGSLIDSAGTVVGAIDYGSGVLSVSTPVFGGGSNNFNLAYTKAVAVDSVSETMGQKVTTASRRLTWVVTFDSIPAPGSLSVSYLSQGVWYVLQDDGSGALRGSDASFGAGVLNSQTGTATVTLGALPDAPSEIIYAWASSAAAAALTGQQRQVGATSLNVGIHIATGFVNLNVGGLKLEWDGHVVTDFNGRLAGYGQGTVNYKTGEVVLFPTTLPAPGTTIVCTALNLATDVTGSFTSFTDSGSTWTGNVGPGVSPGSFSSRLLASFPQYTANLNDAAGNGTFTLFDDGNGVLKIQAIKTNGVLVEYEIGTLNYSNGNFALQKSFPNVVLSQPYWKRGIGATYDTITSDGMKDRTVTLSVQNPSSIANLVYPYTYNVGTVVGGTLNFTVSNVQLDINLTSVVTSMFDVVSSPGHTFPVDQRTYYGTLAPGATFNVTGHRYLAAKGGVVYQDPTSAAAGSGTPAGSWSVTTGAIQITAWTPGVAPVVTLLSAAENPAVTEGATKLTTSTVTFRTATAPLASAGFSIRGAMSDGFTFNVTADADGVVKAAPVFGRVDYNTGVVTLIFGQSSAGPAGNGIVDVTDLAVPGVSFVQIQSVDMDSLVYDAVAYSYLPLDPSILGLNPVRLPSDGRVPIFRKGEVAVVHYTHTTTAATHANGDVIDLAMTRLSVANVHGSDGVEITTGFTANLDTGRITVNSIAGWAQPITVTWRIEDAALVTDAQISGRLQLSRQLSHTYPLGSYVSSAYLVGDMQASVSTVFQQQTWGNVWQDTPQGNPILAAYNDIDHPPVVTNAGTVTESWALIFTSNTAYSIVGEHLGTIGVGTTGVDCAPLNTATNTPYFRLAAAGFGNGWSIGNVIRLDTVGALTPLWLARVVQQGDNTLDEDSFTVLVRGDVNKD